MSYEKQGFASGDVLYATQLNAMDDQIADNEDEITNLKSALNNVDTFLEYSVETDDYTSYEQGVLNTSDGSIVSTNNKWVTTDYIPLEQYVKLYKPIGIQMRYCLYSDTNVSSFLNPGSSSAAYNIEYENQRRTLLKLNPSAKYVRISVGLNTSGTNLPTSPESIISSNFKIFTLRSLSEIDTIANGLVEIETLLNAEKKIIRKEEVVTKSVTWNSGYITTTGSRTIPHSTYAYVDNIQVQEGDIVTRSSNNTMRFVCAYDETGAAQSSKGAEQTESYIVPSGIYKVAVSAVASYASNDDIVIYRVFAGESLVITKQLNPSVYYVGTNGNDENEGITPTLPKKTVNSALSSGAEIIVIAPGIYDQTVDLGLAQHGTVELKAKDKNRSVVFRYPDAVVGISEIAVSGYTKVYSMPCDKTFEANNIWIFQEGIPYAETLITDSERHPIQRGYEYRCSDTRIIKCSSSAVDLTSALTEIENSDDYRWYLDSGILYYSRPQSVTESHPICCSQDTSLFSNGNRTITVKMSGIDCKYMSVNLNNTSASELIECKASNVYGNGCFTYDGADGVKFIKCEAAQCFKGTNGDGFNGHGIMTEETFARQTTAILIDCWGHDNRDDGFSDHERCESSIIGGLYEYNRYGGGVTPSYGSHCTCNGVYCRKNGDGGFLYMDSASASEGGVGGQLICYNCVSEENTLWPEHTPSGYKINGHGNKGIFINCKSIGQTYGYYITESDTYVDLIDCGTLNCDNAVGGRTVNFTKKNTTLVS